MNKIPKLRTFLRFLFCNWGVTEGRGAISLSITIWSKQRKRIFGDNITTHNTFDNMKIKPKIFFSVIFVWKHWLFCTNNIFCVVESIVLLFYSCISLALGEQNLFFSQTFSWDTGMKIGIKLAVYLYVHCVLYLAVYFYLHLGPITFVKYYRHFIDKVFPQFQKEINLSQGFC